MQGKCLIAKPNSAMLIGHDKQNPPVPARAQGAGFGQYHFGAMSGIWPLKHRHLYYLGHCRIVPHSKRDIALVGLDKKPGSDEYMRVILTRSRGDY
jgi:hypothetical protein